MEDSNTSILGRLASADVDVRRVALTELDEILEAASFRDLLPLLADEDATVRKLTVQALEEIGDHRALPALLKAADDSEPDVAFAAVTAIREFRTPEYRWMPSWKGQPGELP
jgi:HEAT repeat protein